VGVERGDEWRVRVVVVVVERERERERRERGETREGGGNKQQRLQ